MLFDSIRHNRSLRLAVFFSFAAASPLQALPRETPEARETRIATAQRLSDLRQQIGDINPAALAALANAGMCAHGSSGSSGSSGIAGAAAACPVQRRKRAGGDHGHLLVFDHWV